MPIGVVINCLSVVIGGLCGGVASRKLLEQFKQQLNMVLGICSIGMGIFSIYNMKYLPPVIFSLVIGTSIGLLMKLGTYINQGATQIGNLMGKIANNDCPSRSTADYVPTIVTALVLFCASGTGIYGGLIAGMMGDSSILISKSILDLFTAAIFACNVGMVIAFIALPQLAVFILLLILSHIVYPLTTPNMVADFKACGGFLMVATGFRILKLKDISIADMLPAMIFVMPLSWLWEAVAVPLLAN